MIKLNKQFRMTAKEIQWLRDLDEEKPNLPATKLTQKEIAEIDRLYSKYIRWIDNRDWTEDLWKMEKHENWPSGSRMKNHQATRIVLGHLLTVNDHKGDMTDKVASRYFLNMLKGIRTSFQHVLYYAYMQD